MNNEEFLFAATKAALAASRLSALPPGVTVAQAALESAFGRSQLAREAHNYFGIKAHGAHAIEFPTREVLNGKPVWISARFARYGSMPECFADRDQLILKLAAYAEARACARHPQAFLRALARHWATDPAYADKLARVYAANALDKVDDLHHASQ